MSQFNPGDCYEHKKQGTISHNFLNKLNCFVPCFPLWFNFACGRLCRLWTQKTLPGGLSRKG